jgi:hypothetical protein
LLHKQHPLVPSGRRLGWAGYTVLIAVFVIREKRKSCPHPTFWVVLASLFVARTAAYAVVFLFVETWRGIWFLPITLVECPLLLSVLDRFGRTNKRMLPKRPLVG